MKKLFIIIAVMLLALGALASCTDEADNTVTPDEIVDTEPTEPGNTKTQAIADYYSRNLEGGFAGYLKAFPADFIAGYRNDLGYDDPTFKEALDNATYTIQVGIEEQYEGNKYCLDYELDGEEEVPEDEKMSLIKDLVAYCNMSASSIEKMVRQTYIVNTYGLIVETDEVIMHEERHDEIILLYVKDEGWYVSPTNFELP